METRVSVGKNDGVAFSGRIGLKAPVRGRIELELVGKEPVRDLLGAQRVLFTIPLSAQRLRTAVLLEQPAIPQFGELVRVRTRQRVELAPGPARNDGILVINLDDRDPGIVDVRFAGIRVHVLQQVFGVFLLKLDHTRVEVVDSFIVRRKLIGVREPVPLLERARHVEIDIHVDPILVQAGNEIVELIELLGVDLCRRLVNVLTPDIARVHMVQADDANAESRERVRE